MNGMSEPETYDFFNCETESYGGSKRFSALSKTNLRNLWFLKDNSPPHVSSCSGHVINQLCKQISQPVIWRQNWTDCGAGRKRQI